MTSARPSLRGALAAVAVWLFAAAAWAQAVVDVEVRNAEGAPADGEVTLESLEGKRVASCTTEKGRCSLGKVAGGSYRVRVAPKQGESPKPRRVMVPPEGKVSLIVNTGG